MTPQPASARGAGALAALARAGIIGGAGDDAAMMRWAMAERRKIENAAIASLASVLVSTVVALLGPWAAGAQAPATIEWDGGRLGVQAEQVPLHDVLDAVARRTGVAFHGTAHLQDDVSFYFSGLSLAEALKRLAGGFNHVIVEETTPRGEIRPVLVLFLSKTGSSGDRRHGELAAKPGPITGPSQTEAERAEVESASRQIAARVLLDQADAQALPPGLARSHLLLELERGLARQAELDRLMEAAARRGTTGAAGGKAEE